MMTSALAISAMSSRHLLPGTMSALVPAFAAQWVPGTSPGMTGVGVQNLIGISLEGSVD